VNVRWLQVCRHDRLQGHHLRCAPYIIYLHDTACLFWGLSAGNESSALWRCQIGILRNALAVCVAGDEMFADSYPMREVEDGFFWEVDGKVIYLC
jgi:hypothetical protein